MQQAPQGTHTNTHSLSLWKAFPPLVGCSASEAFRASLSLSRASQVEVDVDELDMETFNKVMTWAQSKTKSTKEGPPGGS